MSTEEKNMQKKKPEIKSKQVRARVTSTISDFVKKDGIYHKHLRKMCFHRFHVIMLGSQMAIKSRTEECMTNSLYISTQRDFSERYQPAPNGEIMSEGFGKDQSLSMEGVCLSLKPCNRSEQIKIFYSHLSDD